MITKWDSILWLQSGADRKLQSESKKIQKEPGITKRGKKMQIVAGTRKWGKNYKVGHNSI